MWLIVTAGALICAHAVNNLPVLKIDRYFLLLVIVTGVIGSRVAIPIPKINANITVDDTFVYITLLLYGGEAACLLGAMAGVCSGLRISRKIRTVSFGGGALACAVFLTATVLKLIFGSTTDLFSRGPQVAIVGLCLMGLVHYFSHTGIGAIANALKDNQSIWHMWSRNFLWMSITYFAGAAGAGVIVSSVGTARLYALIGVVPLLAIVYFSYDRYLREVKSAARASEEAERRRAELEHERAEQAERHVQELNNYIVEQERISRVLEETKDHFRHAAFHDSLTGLPNRAMFTELLKAEIESSKRRPHHLFAVLFLDLDL
jgi:hypothetical protein